MAPENGTEHRPGCISHQLQLLYVTHGSTNSRKYHVDWRLVCRLSMPCGPYHCIACVPPHNAVMRATEMSIPHTGGGGVTAPVKVQRVLCVCVCMCVLCAYREHNRILLIKQALFGLQVAMDHANTPALLIRPQQTQKQCTIHVQHSGRTSISFHLVSSHFTPHTASHHISSPPSHQITSYQIVVDSITSSVPSNSAEQHHKATITQVNTTQQKQNRTQHNTTQLRIEHKKI